jgi:hypothetical protein
MMRGVRFEITEIHFLAVIGGNIINKPRVNLGS